MKINFSYLILVLILISSCKRNEPTSWDTHVFAPLAKGKITLGDIVADSLLQSDENNLWHLLIHENLADFQLDSVVKIQDTIIKNKFTVPINGGPFTLPNGTTLINLDENNLIGIHDAQLKLAKVKSGLLKYSIKSYINGYLTCTYSIPGVKHNGTGTFIETTTEPKQGNQPYIFSDEIDLAGYEISLTGQNGFMTNRIYSHFKVITSPTSPAQTLVYGQDSIIIELQFIDPVIEYAKGYFGQHDYDLNQNIEFAAGDKMPEGILRIEEATMNLDIVNSVGIDAQIKFNEVAGNNPHNGNTILLEHEPLYQWLNITRAIESYGNIQTTAYHYTLNNSNSNLKSFIENLPGSLNLNAKVRINPLGNLTDGNDFIYTDNTLNALLQLDVPLNIGMENISFKDTIDIENDLDLSADGEFILIVRNAFPFSASCDASLINSEGNVVSLFLQNGFIDHAILSPEPGVTEAVESVIRISANDEVLRSFNKQNKLTFHVKLNTPSIENTYGLYRDYYMDYKIIADGKARVKYE